MPRPCKAVVFTLSIWSVLYGGPWSGRLESQVLYDVSISDPQNQFAGLHSSIESNVLAAADLWGQQLAGNSTIEILVRPSAQVARAQARSLAPSFVGASGGFNVFQQGMAAELKSGFDPNGGTEDVEILLSPDFVRDLMWFDPSPATRTDPVDPSRTDAVSVFLHELGHAIGFNGWINGTTGQFPGVSKSTFDQLATFDGTNFFFIGPQARSVYGGDVPLTFGDPIHVGNSSPRPGANLVPDLMNGVTYNRGIRYDISTLDLAMMQDIGVPLSTDEPPRVTDVFLRGASWADELLSFVGGQGVGDATFGVRANGALQLSPQPWTNIDEVSIRFDEQVQVDFADLQIGGVSTANYILDSSGFHYDPASLTATWRLDAVNPFITSDQIQVVLSAGSRGVTDLGGKRLDGEWTDGLASGPSGDGVTGGDFVFRVNVAPGDADRSGTVSVTDMVNVGSRASANPSIGGGAYDIHHDVNGDATIDMGDLVAIIGEVTHNALMGTSASQVSGGFDGDALAGGFQALTLTALPSFDTDDPGKNEWPAAPLLANNPGLPTHGLDFSATVSSVPEPSSISVLLVCLLLAAMCRRRFFAVSQRAP
jgi:hypothetical protein